MARKDSDKLPPHSDEAEAGVLGCIFLNPTESIMRCLSQLPSPEVFYSLAHRKIYELLLVMHDGREPIDMLTVLQRLQDAGQVEAVGGRAYIASLPDSVPNAGHLDTYIQIVFGKFKLRSMVRTCKEIEGRIYDDEERALDCFEDMQRDLVRVSQMSNRKSDWSVKDSIREAIKDIEADIKSGGDLTGLSTGFVDLDRKTRGLQKDDFIVIAGRPGLGKTTIACNIADHLAVDCHIPVGIISLEMSKKSLMRRMISARSRINLFSLDNDLYVQEELCKIANAGGRLATAPLHIEDASGMDDVQVRGVIRQMYHEHGIKLAIVDYLQRLKARRRFDSRAQEVAYISNETKDLARELHIPVIVCAQLNREVENRKGERPRISDLKESGGIEQDADLIALLYATKTDDDDTGPNMPAALLIGKARNGPTGTIHLTFRKDIFRFEQPPKIRDKDVPREAPSDPRFKD